MINSLRAQGAQWEVETTTQRETGIGNSTNYLELLAPAGNLEKGKVALAYGADAVYLAGEQFGLRARAGNFTTSEMQEMVEYAHARQAKVYVTVNIIPHNRHLIGLPDYLERLGMLGVDGLIVADPAVITLAQTILPDMPLHLSTQANVTNWRSARFWWEQGISRIVLARELSCEEIAEIHARVPQLELEAFVHGAMCMSYSGRCLLSAFMTGRSANLGDCAQSCRWRYALVEEMRPGEYYPVEETEEGTFIFNSRDLCLLDEIPLLAQAGVQSLKIEGRMKSVHYVATVVAVYRQALDRYYQAGEYSVEPEWLEELDKVSHRPYTKGFFYGNPGASGQDYVGEYISTREFVGMVREYDQRTGTAVVDVKNRIRVGDELEILVPGGRVFRQTLTHMEDVESGQTASVAHPNWQVRIPVDRPVAEYAILRRDLDPTGNSM